MKKWIAGMLTDDATGLPSATRHAALLLVIVLVVLAFMGAEAHTLDTLAVLIGTLLTGSQLTKAVSRKKSAAKEPESEAV